MKQQEVFKKIGGIIREINEQYEYLETVEGVLNELELELMVANSHFLTDHIEILRKLNTHAANTPAPQPQQPVTVAEIKPAPVEEPVSEPRFFEPVTAEEPETEPITYLDETPANTYEFEVPRQAEDHTDHFPAPEEVNAEVPEPKPEHEQLFEPETIRHELTAEEIGEDWDEDEVEETPAQIVQPVPEPVKEAPEPIVAVTAPEPVVEAPKPEPIQLEPAKQPEPEIVKPAPQPVAAQHTQILVPEEQVLTFNQRMSAQLGAANRMSDHLGAQPITDLKSAISLNDKLLYIKDLFNGYGLAYSEAIDTLNRFTSYEEAESFLKTTYSIKNNWQDKQTTAEKFYALLQRRYLS